MVKDRFKKLAHNYAEHFDEVFEMQGFSYGDFQRKAFEAASKEFSDIQNISILDIGCGDGETLKPFVDARCKNLTGIDLNKEMLDTCKKRLGNKVKLIQADATDMKFFRRGQFDLILTGACIHNIPVKIRPVFWKELLRLNPLVFVAAEKIADPDPKKHKEYYLGEVNAIIKVYKEKYGLNTLAEEYVNHYEYDEREKMSLEEIKSSLKENYNVSLFAEIKMWKVVVAVRKD